MAPTIREQETTTMARTTRKQVEGTFRVWLKVTGRREATSYDDHGGYTLDYLNPGGGGGYVIERICDDSAGVDQPFGPMRRSAGEMWHTLHFAIRDHEDQQRRAER